MNSQLLDDKFFEKVLSSYHKDPGLKVTEIHFDSGSSEEIHHYASSMERVTVDFSSFKTNASQVSVIVKQAPTTLDATVLKLNYKKTFETEIKLYSEIIPKIEELFTSIGDECKLAPTLLYSSTIPNPILVLEDLNSLGYKVAKSFLNLPRTLKVVEKLAKFHAGSVILQETGAVRVESVKNSWFHM